MQRKREHHEDDCVDELRTIIQENRAELTDIEQADLHVLIGRWREWLASR